MCKHFTYTTYFPSPTPHQTHTHTHTCTSMLPMHGNFKRTSLVIKSLSLSLFRSHYFKSSRKPICKKKKEVFYGNRRKGLLETKDCRIIKREKRHGHALPK
ncbi:Hypothetical predicted protein [Octopus vulgaris]|uniref:Uncharacterized protein n=1 Tax=Octopus vulgaris TaxID=6645 RepID=A0AA36BYZ5_OCTVU|nr:Hypothetical predicted protein [Octopus vulgaris]